MKNPRRSLLAVLIAFMLVAASTAQAEFVHSLPGDLIRRDVATTSYKGHQVIRVQNPSKALLRAVGSDGLDVWGRGELTIDIRVAGDDDVSKIRKFNGGVINYDIVVSDVQALLDKDVQSRTQARESVGSAAVPTDISYFNSFHVYPEIVEFLQTKCSQFSDICSFGSMGKTVEGRDIAILKLGIPGDNKPQVYLEALLHAREWAGTTTAQFIFYQLLEQSKTNPEVKSLLEKAEIHIAPLVNVDGYMFTHSGSGNRLWRKNRARNGGSSSYGVDLNRNFEYKWGNGGSSTNPRDDTYRGPRPGSEPETQAVTRYFKANLPRAVAGLDIHAFSELILRPWGDTDVDTPHESQYKAVTDRMRDLIAGVHGEQFRSIKSIDLYPTSGSANDLFYSLSKVDSAGNSIKPYGVAFEIRPKSGFGGGGFILPENQIVKAGEEIYPAFLHFARNAIDNPLRA